ncbi:PLP-dependent aminotransferase family protein [Peptococcus simiae]|uniref:MocR-like pyridoxine biosynthesis transcription factor PdxR n=1 Tax=Peptococcus simiae TaxID=1643805 RepID=UPI0039813FBF
MLTIDKNSCIYKQIYLQLRNAIINNDLKYLDRLPSKRGLAGHLNVSVNSVERAYHMLVDEEFIEARGRSGFYVNHIDHSFFKKSPPRVYTEEPKPHYRYNFSHLGVDRASFPHSVWKRLCNEVLLDYEGRLLMPGHYQGEYELRQEIAHFLADSRGIQVDPSMIVITSGLEYSYLILFQLLGHLHFGLENPSFERLKELFTAHQINYSCIDLDELGAIPNATIEPIDILTLTPSHQFPTGRIMPLHRRTAFLDLANIEKKWIIEDDYDGEFKYRGTPLSPLKAMDIYDRVIYMGNFSNTIFPGLRLSYMILPAPLLDRYQKTYSLKCSVPLFIQLITAKFIESGAFMRHLNRMKRVYRIKQETILTFFQDIPDADLEESDAGLFLVLRVRSQQSEAVLCQKAENQGILIRPLSYFELTDGQFDKVFLLSFASIESVRLSEGLQALAQAWDLL